MVRQVQIETSLQPSWLQVKDPEKGSLVHMLEFYLHGPNIWGSLSPFKERVVAMPSGLAQRHALFRLGLTAVSSHLALLQRRATQMGLSLQLLFTSTAVQVSISSPEREITPSELYTGYCSGTWIVGARAEPEGESFNGFSLIGLEESWFQGCLSPVSHPQRCSCARRSLLRA